MPHLELRILLIEDFEDDVFFFKRSLARAGIPAQVQVAGDGNRAAELLTGNGALPDVIFLDLKMPNFNGFELLQWLKEHPERRSPRVIVLTSSGEPHERAQAHAL